MTSIMPVNRVSSALDWLLCWTEDDNLRYDVILLQMQYLEALASVAREINDLDST